MEINGVSFKDYACAMANSVAGLSEEKICEVLGLEQPVWDDTKTQWVSKMAEMTMDDMKFYGEVFTNPKQGKFANVEGGAAGPEEAIKKVGSLENYLNIFWRMSKAAEHGIDTAEILNKEYDMNLTEWSQASMHYSAIQREMLDVNDPQYNDRFEEHHQLDKSIQEKWEAFYADQSTGVADDIDF